MRWQSGRRSDNVEDRRSVSPRMMGGGGVGLLVIALIVWMLGGNPLAFLNMAVQQGGAPVQRNQPGGPAEDQLREFVSVVLADTEDVWTEQFAQQGRHYTPTTLVLFRDQVRSGCGVAGSRTGPFYCPIDGKVYLDLSFFDELDQRFGAPGDFAQAYVVAHEVGHHVQDLLGISDRIQSQQAGASEVEANELSVRLELQADFFAGVWAHHAQKMRNILEPGDIEEALNAATAIGDDRLQSETQGYVVPDSFQHGTSQQRARWFRKGFETGDMSQGDTFHAANL